MVVLKNIKIENFLSFRQCYYGFSNNITTLVIGNNKSDDNTLSNGSGKSSFFEAIFFALSGDFFRNVPIKKMIHNGGNSSSVELVLQDNSDQYVINRKVFINKPQQLSITKNTLPVPFSSVLDGNKVIFDLLGVTSDYLKSFYFVNSKHKSFFSLPDTDKKSFISKFSRSDAVKDVYPFIESETKELLQEKEKLEITILQEKARESEVLFNIDMIKNVDYEKEKEKRINELELQIRSLLSREQQLKQSLSNVLPDYSDLIAELQTKVRLADENLNKIDFEKEKEQRNKIENIIQSVRNEISDCDKSIDKENLESLEYKKELLRIENLLQNLIICPRCKLEFSLQEKDFDHIGAEYEKSDYIAAINAIEESIKGLKLKKSELFLKIQEWDAQLKDVREKEKHNQKIIDDNYSQKSQCLNKINNLQRQLQSYLMDKDRNEKLLEENFIHINNLKERIKQIQNETRNDGDILVQCEKKLKLIQKEILSSEELLSVIDDKISSSNASLNVFKKFYSYLTTQSLTYIERKINTYLYFIGCNFEIILDGLKEKSDGTFSEKIDCLVKRNGFTEGGIESYSMGERAKIEAATILACQDILIESGSNFSFLALDEVFDSCDKQSLQGIIDCLSQTKKTILMISHIDLQEIYPTIVIEKQNNASTIL